MYGIFLQKDCLKWEYKHYRTRKLIIKECVLQEIEIQLEKTRVVLNKSNPQAS